MGSECFFFFLREELCDDVDREVGSRESEIWCDGVDEIEKQERGKEGQVLCATAVLHL
jgi:hypothetical protein